MAVHLFSGTPGSGKSYHSIITILDYLRRGKYVAANFPMVFSKREIKKGYDKRFAFVPTSQITVEKVMELGKHFDIFKRNKENLLLIVIDEASIVFNPREFKRDDRLEWINFLAQHRHYGFSFLLITQVDRMIDRQIRGLIECEFKHRKANKVGALFLLPFSLFACIEYWYQVRERLGVTFLIYRKSIAKHYSTMYDFRQYMNAGEEALSVGRVPQGGDLPEECSAAPS